MTKAFQIAATAFLITAAAIKAAPAIAEPVTSATNVSLVRTTDLDLSTAHGQRVLDVRLAHAAREVCGTASDVDLAGQNDVRKCRTDVLGIAKGQRDQLLAAAGRGTQIALTKPADSSRLP
jgi:UrcA family protein